MGTSTREYPRISQLMVSRIVIVLHILLPVIPVVFSLQCYNCTSHHHPDCLAYWKVEDDERYQKYIITCDSDDDLCTQKTDMAKGSLLVHRYCSHLMFEGCNSDGNSCQHSCSDDLCNMIIKEEFLLSQGHTSFQLQNMLILVLMLLVLM